MHIENSTFFPAHLPKEGWVSIPNKQNIKRYGWKKQVSLTLGMIKLFATLSFHDFEVGIFRDAYYITILNHFNFAFLSET